MTPHGSGKIIEEARAFVKHVTGAAITNLEGSLTFWHTDDVPATPYVTLGPGDSAVPIVPDTSARLRFLAGTAQRRECFLSSSTYRICRPMALSIEEVAQVALLSSVAESGRT